MKKEYKISSGTGKNTTSQILSPTLHGAGQSRYFTALDRHTIKLYKSKMDSKFTKSHQWSMERSYVVLNEINPEFWSRPSHFLKKSSHKKSSHN